MRKILRKTWKEEEQQPKCDDPLRLSEDLASGIEPPRYTPELRSDASDPSLSSYPPKYSNKRSRDAFETPETQETVLERPVKALRTEETDSIRNHLPEIHDEREREEQLAPLSSAELKEKIMHAAKSINTIAALPQTKSSFNLLVELISWAVDHERTRLKHSNRKRRTILFIVEDVPSMDKYTVVLEQAMQTMSIARYNEEIHQPDLQTWDELTKKDLVITTSNYLLDSLLRGALAVTQIHLIVLLDAQSVKNQDCHPSIPIVQVMNDFYRVTDSLSRPRIFAFAALSSDRKLHFDSKMLKLEQMLDAKVFGVSDAKRDEIMALPDRPEEVVILYDNLKRSFETRLLKLLHQIDPNESVYRSHYSASRLANEEVGACASDLVWRRALKEMDNSMPWLDSIDDEDSDGPSEEGRKSRIQNIVKHWAFTMPNLDASSKGFNVSHKFLRLVQVLMTFRSYGEGFRGIIFVQRRAIALVLADLLKALDDRLGFLRPCAIVGYRTASDGQQHREIFQKFAIGVFNLLVATKSNEDLDIPRASVVIRYDLFESQISHAYVRARTRGRESHLIHMAERGNDAHRRILSRITALDTSMLKWTESLCKRPESSVPPESLRETINPYYSGSEDEDSDVPYIRDPTTSGRIYAQDATTVLYRYASSVRPLIDALDDAQLFEFRDVDKEFGVARNHLCIINLPGTPVNGINGAVSPSKAEARRSACYRACTLLSETGLLDSRLVPLSSRLRAQHESDHKKVSDKDGDADAKTGGTSSYQRRFPVFWSTAPKGIPSKLYPTIIHINQDSSDSELYGPIVLLTREPTPTFLACRLFSSGISSTAEFQKATPITVGEEQMETIRSFTVRLCRAIMNKALTCALSDMAYFFLPLSPTWRAPLGNDLQLPGIASFIPWDTVRLASEHWAVPIEASSPEAIETDLRDAIIQDRWIEFTRRYKVVAVRKDMTPMSKPTDGSRESRSDNLWEFCKAKRKGLETLNNFEQPILQVAKLHAVLNHLNPTNKPPATASKCPAKYLIPELCAKFTIPASTMRTAMLLPSIMKRIDELLLVKEMDAQFFDHAVREDLLHNALCTPSAGLEYNYERLELLGDAFLKYLASVYCFVTNPSLSEGSLHVARQRIISNKCLLAHASRIGMPGFIQSKVFAYKAWQPPNFRVHIPPKAPKPLEKLDPKPENEEYDGIIASAPPEGYTQRSTHRASATGADDDEDMEQSLIRTEAAIVIDQREDPDDFNNEDSGGEPDSPVDQATIWAAISSTVDSATALAERQPISAGQKMVSQKKKKRKKGGSDDQLVQWLGDKAIADVAEAIIGAAYISGGREAALQVTKAFTLPLSHIDSWSDFGRKVLTPPPNFTAKLRPGSIAAIERIIGHKFNRPHLLAQALTHSSIQGYETTSYERLEFIGDAILDFMVIRHIYDRDHQLSPGALTMLKGAMVSNSALAAVCVWSGMQDYLLFESSALELGIQSYVNELKGRQEAEYAAAEQEGRSPGQYWLDIEPPKALSDVVESIIGAIYISDNFSPIGAESLFDNVLKPFYDKHITLHTLSHHPTKILFELLQAQGCQQFEITKDKDDSITCCHVVVHGVILASGEDTTPTSAARLASLFALDAVAGDANFMTRTCDCRTHSTRKKSRKKTEFEQALEKALSAAGDDFEDSQEEFVAGSDNDEEDEGGRSDAALNTNL